jgi:molecular chaperone DnaK
LCLKCLNGGVLSHPLITVGIDLGTTNTVAALQARVFDLDPKSGNLLPSVVAFPPTGTQLVGTVARRRRPIDPQNTIYSAKRLMGKKWFSYDVKDFRQRYPFRLVEDPEGFAAFETRGGRFNPTDVAALLLQRVCLRSGHPPAKVTGIITVPSMFQEAERQATVEAGKLVGMAGVELIDEPIAAALAYLGVAEEKPGLAAVYDLGGGTFDLALVDCREPRPKIVASGGDLYLGGDMDLRLSQWAADEMLRTHRWEYRNEPEVLARLILECEQAKIRLSRDRQTSIDMTRVDLSSPFTSASIVLDRKRLSSLCGDIVRRTFILCDEVLGKAGVKPRQIDAVFVVGGPTQLPMFQEGIREYFGKPVRYQYDPMYVVAIGASAAGHILG